MSDRKVIRLAGVRARNYAVELCTSIPEGWFVTFEPAKKKRIQEEKYHAQMNDIADQSEYAGRKWSRDDMKRILIDEFADAMREAGTPLHNDGRLIPSENGRRVIQLGIQSRDFYVAEASAFIEFLYAWGADRNVVWTEPETAEHTLG